MQQSLAGQQEISTVPKNVSIQKFKQHMQEKIQLAQKNIDEGEFQLPQVVARQAAGIWSPENMASVPLSKAVQPQSRIAPQVLGIKVSESKKRVRLQDREDVTMDGSSSSTSQEMDEQTAANQMLDGSDQVNHGDDKRFIVKPKRRV